MGDITRYPASARFLTLTLRHIPRRHLEIPAIMTLPASPKTNNGRFFEDFCPGEIIDHPIARTLTDGDHALNLALTGSRHALFSDRTLAFSCGLDPGMVDPMLVFHLVFGKTVGDISLNAIANLGYAEGRFLAPVVIGDTLRARSTILGIKENSSGENGVVYVRSEGFNQYDHCVLTYARWVMVRKRDRNRAAPVPQIPVLSPIVAACDLVLPPGLRFENLDRIRFGGPHAYEDYAIGERIDHAEAMAVEEAEHQIATRLYQNNARLHFDLHGQKATKLGARLIYGGVAISLARALSCSGLGGASLMLAINGGRHVNPLLAGDTLYAWSEVLDRAELSETIGALRLRLVALKNRPAADFTLRTGTAPDAPYAPEVVLDFDYWAAIPRRSAFSA